MTEMFLYNWQIREEWLGWCETLSPEELEKKRAGGMGSILHNLYHVVYCEQYWINHLRGTPVLGNDMKNITTLQEVKAFSALIQPQTHQFLQSYPLEGANQVLEHQRKDGSIKLLPYEKVLRHITAHEIHHIGQLSVWSRDMGLKPVSSDLIYREFV
ncbi:DinB family protein [Planococcus sp. 1R117A]|uniref:DinB family protein n=1 Tax=Planococcus sp. 1R117A TaxID=3447020 RepID=UPI003EDBE395